MAETGWATLIKLIWERIAHFFPNWVLKKAYPRSKLSERLLLFTTGGSSGGPQLNVKPGGLYNIGTNEIVVVNLLPFTVDLENIHAEVLLGGMQLGSKDVGISRPIVGMSSETIDLRFELSDNQAAMARNYESPPPILQMGITANFRTHLGLVSLRYDVRILTVIYK